MKDVLIERLTSYAKIDTQSDDSSDSCPSTPGQWKLARQLKEELESIGMQEVTIDDHAYVMATLPANTDKPNVPTIGFLAHVDTATDFTGAGVNPQIVESYGGGEILLNKELNVTLSPIDFPDLDRYIGHTLVTTDGTTLLGADNKAGIAEIMTAMAYLTSHPEIKHGTVRVAFTPDEEIGRGPHKFDVEAFGAKFAYTVDGGPIGELEFESFNAAKAKVTLKGKSVHPGTAKGKMVNAMKMAMAVNAALPVQEAPESTEGHEGFYHLSDMKGNVEHAEMNYIIRDFDREAFQARKANLEKIVLDLQETYGEGNVILEMEDQYYNMKDKIEPVKEIVDIAYEAMESLGIEPVVKPVRGGTDGSQLSYKGLPTPNIFTGGENYHGKYEFISADNMVKATNVIIEIVKGFEQKG